MIRTFLEKYLIFFVLVSILFHFVVLNIRIPKPPQAPLISKSKTFTLRKITPKTLAKLKTAGVKNGHKDFSLAPGRSSLSIASLRPQLSKRPILKQDKLSSSKIGTFKKTGNLSFTQNKSMLEIKNWPVAANIPKAFGNTNVNIGFDTPQGVSFDQLNSIEKRFYSFNKRSFETYISSLIKSLQILIREKPYLNYKRFSGNYTLIGKLSFNREGETISTRFLKMTGEEDIQQLFENTLMEIRSIPNPPKELISKNGTFSIYYKLRVGP
jgi:hypothetical protein